MKSTNDKLILTMENAFEKRIHQHIIFNGFEECYEDIKRWIAANGFAVDQLSFHRGHMYFPSTYGVETASAGDIIVLDKQNTEHKTRFLVLTSYKRHDIWAKPAGVAEPAASLN